jgi:hypothetical protein
MTTSTNWSAPTSPSEVARRAAGRKKYNRQRQRAAQLRRRKVAALLFRRGWLSLPGYRLLIARRLGVSIATVARDIKTIMRTGYDCPTCGSHVLVPPRLRVPRE